MCLVSVLMPSYNHEKYIAQAIESVLNQTFGDLELLILDDASKDHTREIIESYRVRDKRVKPFYHAVNKGIALTMNELLDKAQGEYVALFASDDLWFKDKVEKQLRILKDKPDCVVWTEGLIIDSEGNSTGTLFTQYYRVEGRKRSGNIFLDLLKGNYICGQSVIAKTEYIKSNRFDERITYSNDYKLWVEIAKTHEFYFIAEPLTMYRLHGENTVCLKEEVMQKEFVILLEVFLQEYKKLIPRKVRAELFEILSSAYRNIRQYDAAEYYMKRAKRLAKIDVFEQ